MSDDDDADSVNFGTFPRVDNIERLEMFPPLVLASVVVDGEYRIQVQVGTSGTRALDRPEACTYATAIAEAVSHAEYDAAVIGWTSEQPESDANYGLLITAVLSKRRQVLDPAVTEPLEFFGALIVDDDADETITPVVGIRHAGGILGNWPVDYARQAAMNILTYGLTTAVGDDYYKLLTTTGGDKPVMGAATARAIVHAVHIYRVRHDDGLTWSVE